MKKRNKIFSNKLFFILSGCFSLFLLSMNLVGYLDIISFAIIESSFLIFSLLLLLSKESEMATSVVIDDDDHVHFVFDHYNENSILLSQKVSNFRPFLFIKKSSTNKLSKFFSCQGYPIIINFLVELRIFFREKSYNIIQIFNFQMVSKTIIPVRAGPNL